MKAAVDFWVEKAGIEYQPEIELEAHQLGKVLEFLQRLTSTREYNNVNTQKYLAERVMDVFKMMEQDVSMRGLVANLMFYGVTSCDDRIIDTLDEIELKIQVEEIEKKGLGADELRELGKGFLFLELVNEKAKEHIATLPYVDEIEVYLAFKIGLADRLKLPIKTRNMIFRNCADITDDEIAALGDAIEERFSEEMLNDFLKSWSPWVDYQRKGRAVPAFADLPVDEEKTLGDDDICWISLEKPEQPVSYKGTLYDYDQFVQQYRTNGTNPLKPDEPIDMTLLKRVEVSS